MQDSMVKGLILNSLDSSLIGNFHRYPTAREVWDALATTFFDGGDSSQIYDLQQKVNQLKQSGGSLENYYNDCRVYGKKLTFDGPIRWRVVKTSRGITHGCNKIEFTNF